MTIKQVMKRFGPDFEAARELVREKYGSGEMLAVIRQYRAEHLCSLEQAMSDLAEGARVGDVKF
jgi:hypothetical protein